MRAVLSVVLLAITLGAAIFALNPGAAAVAGAQAPAREPNELGRVMILEYHKIDHPEGRWTRTPENFRRDLQRLWERGYRLVALNDYLDGKIRLPAGTTPV
ncbi:MAG: polysaccharide deacetylase family protein, partial [Candidatus Rokuibacteriota bacterium]